MNYLKLYEDFISERKFRIIWAAYIERHHIIPKSLGGNDDDDNIVLLSAGEHFLAHYYLYKIHGGKMTYAFGLMYTQNKKKLDEALLEEYAAEYQIVREEINKKESKRQKGIPKGPMSDETKKKMIAINTGRKHTDAARKNMSDAKKGKTTGPKSEETKRKIGESNKISQLNRPPIKEETREKISNAGKGRIVSDETREKLSKALKESEKFKEHNNNRKPHSEEAKQNMSNAAMGKPKSEEHRKNMFTTFVPGHTPHNKGVSPSEDTKRKISEKLKGTKIRINPDTGKREFYRPEE